MSDLLDENSKFSYQKKHADAAKRYQRKAEQAMAKGDRESAIKYHNKMVHHQRIAIDFSSKVKDLDNMREGLEEHVLTIPERIKRGQVMRRNENKIERAREIAKRKIAPEKNINKRAFSQARQIVRRKVAGQRGAEYADQGPSEKIAIDRLVDNKTKLIKKIALRLIPRVRQAEQKRLQSFLRGQSLKNQGAPESKSPPKNVNEELNSLFETEFKDKGTEKKRVKLYPKDPKIPVKILGKFDEEKILGALIKKSEKSGIELDILGEVYDRGLASWSEEFDVSPTQYAFARVNSFINQGKTYFEEDVDLAEIASKTLHSYLNKSNKSMADIADKKVAVYGNIIKKNGGWIPNDVYSDPEYKKLHDKETTRIKGIKLARAKLGVAPVKRRATFEETLKEAHEYRIRETNPGGLHTRHSVQRVKKGSNQPIGQATIYDNRKDAEEHVTKVGGKLRETKPDFHYQTGPGAKPKKAFNLSKYLENSEKRQARMNNTKSAMKEESELDEMSWEKHIQYDNAARADRMDTFKKSLDHIKHTENGVEDTPERQAMIRRIEKRNQGIKRVMDRSNSKKYVTVKEENVDEEVRSVDKEPVIMPAVTMPSGKVKPSKVVMKRTNRKIIGSGNVHDGENNG